MQFGRWMRRTAVVVALASGSAGCADLDTVKNAPLDKGITHVFDAPYSRVTAVTLTVLSSENINVVGSSEDATGTIYLVDKSIAVTSWGEVGRIYIKKAAVPPTTVIVYWEKRARGGEGISAEDFTRVFFEAVGKQL
jgi:hypothetical protein